MMLDIRGVTKQYDGFDAVTDLDLAIPRGQFFCFLGPNGAGKTTTIKMIAALLKPTRGTILVDGHDIQKDPIGAKRLIGYIPDTPYLYEKLTGREFFHFIGDLYMVPRREQEEACERYLGVFNLLPSADKLIESYSHGMRQKLCFAVAFMHKPRLLVVDEPMVGLDPKSGRIVKNLLRQFCADGGTIFLSTHLLYIAQELADRIGIVTRGRLKFLGTTDELRAQLARDGDLEDLFLQLTEEAASSESAPLPEGPAQAAEAV